MKAMGVESKQWKMVMVHASRSRFVDPLPMDVGGAENSLWV